MFIQKKILIASLFYNNLVLPTRNNAFINWVSFGQTFNHFLHLDISVYKHRNLKVSINNSWLSGFTDAEGCFTAKAVPYKNDITKIRIEQRWIKILYK